MNKKYCAIALLGVCIGLLKLITYFQFCLPTFHVKYKCYTIKEITMSIIEYLYLTIFVVIYIYILRYDISDINNLIDNSLNIYPKDIPRPS